MTDAGEIAGSSRRGFRRHAACALAMLTLLGLTLSAPGRKALHALDQDYFGERLLDARGWVHGGEDWRHADVLKGPQDYRWTSLIPGTIRIAHALGEESGKGANTLSAMSRAHALGFRIFEVDLSLDAGIVRCHHGPAAPTPWQSGECRIESLLEALPSDSWLVLDIKTDFQTTGGKILDAARHIGKASQLVFQLYQPAHLALFNAWKDASPELPGPLITAYLSYRSVNHIARHAARAGVHVLTMPIHRVPAYTERPRGLDLYVHPVHDCLNWAQAAAMHAQGAYVLSSMNCPGMGAATKN